MSKLAKDILILISANLILTFLLWLPHLLSLNNFYGLNFQEGFNTIFRNFDGLEYIIIAKSFYAQDIISTLPQSLPHTYYASHFPFYSILMIPFALLLGYLKSMLLVALLSTIAATITFYFLIRDFKLSSSPLTLSLIFIILPARWLIVHSVGSSEPTFILFTLLTFYFFMKYEAAKKWPYIYTSALFGVLAQLTRPPGILLFVALGAYILWKVITEHHPNIFKRILLAVRNYYPLLFIPIALLSIFYYYAQVYRDFFAYFHSGDNIHLVFPPFQVFNKNQFWVGEIWLEDIIYVFIFGFLAVTYLFKQKLLPLAFFVLVYLGASTMVAHRDISRYILPVFPFVLIAFEKVLTSKEFRIVLAIVAVALYLYTQNFLLYNTAPFPNPQLFDKF